MVKSPFWYVSIGEGWLVGLGQEGVAWGWGNCLKYLKRGWNREGRGNRDFKKGGKLGQGVGALKRGGWNPFANYDLEIWYFYLSSQYVHMLQISLKSEKVGFRHVPLWCAISLYIKDIEAEILSIRQLSSE